MSTPPTLVMEHGTLYLYLKTPPDKNYWLRPWLESTASVSSRLVQHPLRPPVTSSAAGHLIAIVRRVFCAWIDFTAGRQQSTIQDDSKMGCRRPPPVEKVTARLYADAVARVRNFAKCR